MDPDLRLLREVAAVETLDVEANLRNYLGDRSPSSRYASFDYCFNHFQSRSDEGRTGQLADADDLQLSCLHLGFYLASWGMLRGSSPLLRRSARALIPTIEALATAPDALWHLDVDAYTDSAVELVREFATTLRGTLYPGASDILVTKIMLGTMGCVPAFDTYFKSGFGVSSFGVKSLKRVAEYYQINSEAIEAQRVPTISFDTGLPTARVYSRAKVIDMIFFIEGAKRRPALALTE